MLVPPWRVPSPSRGGHGQARLSWCSRSRCRGRACTRRTNGGPPCCGCAAAGSGQRPPPCWRRRPQQCGHCGGPAEGRAVQWRRRQQSQQRQQRAGTEQPTHGSIRWPSTGGCVAGKRRNYRGSSWSWSLYVGITAGRSTSDWGGAVKRSKQESINKQQPTAVVGSS